MQFKVYRQRFGDAGFWLVSDKSMPQKIMDSDVVVENKKAEPGQVRKAKLICEGDPGKVKCRWQLEIQKD